MRLSSLALSLVVAAGCGKVKSLTDGSPGADSKSIDANTNQPGVVKVTVLDPNQNGTPFAGVPVVFIDTDNTVTRVISDTQGGAQATVHPGASVSAVEQPSSTQYYIFSVLAVKPGDDITLGFVNQNSTTTGTFSLSFSPDPNAATGTTYQFYGPCGQADGNNVLTFYSNCTPQGTTFSVYGLEFNSQNQLIASTDKNGLTFTNGGSAFLSGWVPAQNFLASYSDIPSFVSNVQMQRWTGYFQSGYEVSQSMATSGTTLSLSATAPGATLHAFVTSLFARNDTGAQQEVTEQTAGNQFTYGIDVAGKTLPWLGVLALDPATETMAVPVDGTAAVDGFITEFNFNRVVNTVTTQFRWDLIAPKGMDIKLPQIPIEAGDVMPKAGDTLGNQIGILVESDGLNSYDDLRPHFFDRINQLFNGLGASNFEISISPNLFNFRSKHPTGSPLIDLAAHALPAANTR